MIDTCVPRVQFISFTTLFSISSRMSFEVIGIFALIRKELAESLARDREKRMPRFRHTSANNRAITIESPKVDNYRGEVSRRRGKKKKRKVLWRIVNAASLTSPL